MIELGTVLTVLTILEKTKGLYDKFTGVSRGEQVDKTLKALEDRQAKIERVADHLLYARDLRQAISVVPGSNAESNEIRSLLSKIPSSIVESKSDVLVSAISSTPRRLQEALTRNPFEVLCNACPAALAQRPQEAGMVPLSFFHEGQEYIGWQKKGALPSMFDCEFWPDTSHIDSSLPGRPLVWQQSDYRYQPADSGVSHERRCETPDRANLKSSVTAVLEVRARYYDTRECGMYTDLSSVKRKSATLLLGRKAITINFLEEPGEKMVKVPLSEFQERATPYVSDGKVLGFTFATKTSTRIGFIPLSFTEKLAFEFDFHDRSFDQWITENMILWKLRTKN